MEIVRDREAMNSFDNVTNEDGGINATQYIVLRMNHGFTILSALFSAAGVKATRVSWLEWVEFVKESKGEGADENLIAAVYQHMDERIAQLEVERDTALRCVDDIQQDMTHANVDLFETKRALEAVEYDKFEALAMAENLTLQKWDATDEVLAGLTQQNAPPLLGKRADSLAETSPLVKTLVKPLIKPRLSPGATGPAIYH